MFYGFLYLKKKPTWFVSKNLCQCLPFSPMRNGVKLKFLQDINDLFTHTNLDSDLQIALKYY